MRTNIVIDDELMERAIAMSGGATKRSIVHEALRDWVLLREQSGIKALRGKVHWEGDLDAMRRDA